MKEFTKFCNSCNEEKEIIKIEKVDQRETIELSCGHKHISAVFFEKVSVSDYIETKHKNSLGKLISKYRTKKSGKTQRPAREIIEIDRKNKKLKHKVWEQNQSEEWLLVHDEEKPFTYKKSD